MPSWKLVPSRRSFSVLWLPFFLSADSLAGRERTDRERLGDLGHVWGPVALRDWCRSRGVFLHSSLRLHWDASRQEHWLRASYVIPPGEELAIAPLGATLGPWGVPPGLVAFLEDRLPEQAVREMVTLAVQLLAEDAQGPSSNFSGYVASLPQPDELRAAMAWADAELTWLPARTAHKVRLGKEGLDRVYETVLAPLKRSKPSFLPRKTLSLLRFRWAYSVVSSRSFNVSLFEGLPTEHSGLFLFPGGDLFNHDPRASIACNYVSEAGVITLRGLAPISAGRQAFNNYGAHLTNEDLLLGWGFQLDTDDVVLLPLERPLGVDSLAREAALKELGLLARPPQPPLDDLARVAALYQVGGFHVGSARSAQARDLVLYWSVLLASSAKLAALMECARTRTSGVSPACRMPWVQALRVRAAEAAERFLQSVAQQLVPLRVLGASDAFGSLAARHGLASQFRASQRAVLESLAVELSETSRADVW